MSGLSEHATRKELIDATLEAAGWRVVPELNDFYGNDKVAVEEFVTAKGPADYALFVKGKLLAIVEAKKVAVGPQNVLEQAKRYSEGCVTHGVGNWNGRRVPFLYSTNGEQIWYLDVRSEINVSGQLAAFHTPDALELMFNTDLSVAGNILKTTPIPYKKLRPYQREAVKATTQAILKGRRRMLLAMATGAGKTYTIVSLIHRLMAAGYVRRVLFLVDRRALAAQAAQAFASFETPSGRKFTQEYEVFSQRFQSGDIEEKEFHPEVLPNSYLTKPDNAKTFVYVSTIQRMTINLFGSSFKPFGEEREDDADELDIPIHAFDLIIADECHRGYTSKETNAWRLTIDHFDALKIGLTATPASHTTTFFQEVVYRYGVEQAVSDGYLVDYEPVAIRSGIHMEGLFLKEGELIEQIDTKTGQKKLDQLEDEREFNSTEIETRITAPLVNRKIILELKKYAAAWEIEHGHFPKTLIFAQNDIAHISHADHLVELCKEVFGRGDDFVKKITGSPNVDRPLQRIKEFRNRKNPGIVVTVDMLSTGVDIPAIEFIVFLRPVKSRILWEQMLGRGTRLCPDINKTHFVVFDCFDGTLINYFKRVTGFDLNPPSGDPLTIPELIAKIYDNDERKYNARVLAKRIGRIDKAISAEGRDALRRFIPDGDIQKFARELPGRIDRDFMATMSQLRDPEFQKMLTDYPRKKIDFYVALEADGEVTSGYIFERDGRSMESRDYLEQFAQFVKEKKTEIEALRIVIERPKDWKTAVLEELRTLLVRNNFPPEKLQKAHQLVHHKALADIISMLKHAAKEEEPILTAAERVDRAMKKVVAGKHFTPDQAEWIGYIREHLVSNLTIEVADFEVVPIFERHGGMTRARKLFKEDLERLIQQLNEAVAA